MTTRLPALFAALSLAATGAVAQTAPAAPPPGYDEALAKRLGADDMGMRGYVFVLLKTGPNRMPDGDGRNAMFRGHFANIQRLADEGKLVQAGPFDGVDGWRGMFVLAVGSIDEARALVATDPVIANGEMIAEYHKLYGSAALMQLTEVHQRIAKKQP